MNYQVSLALAKPRLVAAVQARVPLIRVRHEFRKYLDQVYAAGRDGHVFLAGQNIFLYQSAPDSPDDVIVDFGVSTDWQFSPVGNVRCVELPAGNIVTTTHFGAYTYLGDAHAAIHNWCSKHARTLTGVRWEIYGHWTEDLARLRTDVCYQLTPL